jgi:hypothetical protein
VVALSLSSSPLIDASKLAAYASLLPQAVNAKYLQQTAQTQAVVVEEQKVEHRPLRTKLKSDMKFAVSAQVQADSAQSQHLLSEQMNVWCESFRMPC